MPQQKDFYDVLGVSRTSTPDEVRKAYLKLAHKYHPDKTGGDKAAEEKLKEINEAYDTLKNPDKRRNYDQFGGAGSPFGSGGPFGGGYEGAGGFGAGGFGADAENPFGDLFDALFGRGGAGGGRAVLRPGNDLEYRLRVTLKEAAHGVKKTIKFNRMESCPECSGSGAAAGTQPTRCPTCGVGGQVRRQQGFFSVTQNCPRCSGKGFIVEKPCARCGGGGQVKVSRELAVDLPGGVDTGSRLRITGEGEPGQGQGAPRGDLYIFVEVESHPIFEREGNDIVCEVPISFPEAALGTTIRVPTLKGEADLKVPAGTQSGAVLRLRGMGIPDLRTGRLGDQLVHIQVEIPARLSKEQKELVRQLQESMDEQSHPLHKRFMDKLKKSLGG
jgi:molecular chaperone DnaJ